MGTGGVHLVGAAKADMGPDPDKGRAARLCLRVMDSVADGGGIIAVRQCLDVPAVGFKSSSHIFGVGNVCVAFDGNMVVIVEEDEVAKCKISGNRGGFGADAFHHVAIAADAIDMIVEQFEPGLVK